jgi:AcrR family transcriptional regulator
MPSTPFHPGGSRREQQKAKTRALILASARTLFEEVGYDATTIRAVAKGARVGLGTVILHFEDKPALLVAALFDDLQITMEKAFKHVPEDIGICGQFLHITAFFYEYYAKRPALARVLLKQILFIADTFLQPMEIRFIQTLIGLIVKARENGELRTDIDCRLVAEQFISQYMYVLYTGLGEESFDPKHAITRLGQYLDQIMLGISNPETA